MRRGWLRFVGFRNRRILERRTERRKEAESLDVSAWRETHGLLAWLEKIGPDEVH